MRKPGETRGMQPIYGTPMDFTLRTPLPDHQLELLGVGSRVTGKSRAEIIRHLLDNYLSQALSDLMRESKVK